MIIMMVCCSFVFILSDELLSDGTSVSSKENNGFPLFSLRGFSHPYTGKAFMQAQKCLQRGLLCIQPKYVHFGRVCLSPKITLYWSPSVELCTSKIPEDTIWTISLVMSLAYRFFMRHHFSWSIVQK